MFIELARLTDLQTNYKVFLGLHFPNLTWTVTYLHALVPWILYSILISLSYTLDDNLLLTGSPKADTVNLRIQETCQGSLSISVITTVVKGNQVNKICRTTLQRE